MSRGTPRTGKAPERSIMGLTRRSDCARRLWRTRRGAAIILAMTLVAGSMVLSYALLGSQSTSLLIQRNSASRTQAYYAAMTGLAAGLRQIHDADSWVGVGQNASANISSTESYQVTFTTGDTQLTENHPDYAWWPLRVTIRSIGKSTDPSNPARYTTHTVEAVVQLVPPEISPNSPRRPTRWDEPAGFTVYQWNDLAFKLELPVRIEGRTRIQGQLQLCDEYPPQEAQFLLFALPAKQRYLEHLKRLRVEQGQDYRPFGPDHAGNFSLQLALSNQHVDGLTRLGTYLGINYSNRAAQAAPNWSPLVAPQTYQLYPGGEVYQIPSLNGSLQNTSAASGVLKFRPQENPLGLFYRSGNLQIQNNVALSGTLLVTGELDITGSNVSLNPKSLPWLRSTEAERLRLPTTFAGKILYGTTGGQLNGLFHATNQFMVRRGPQSSTLDLQGRLQTGQLIVHGRDGLYNNQNHWNTTALYALFDPNPLYPLYCADFFDPEPKIVFRPDPENIDYHWQDFSEPLFEAPAGESLQWDLLRIMDDVRS